jgi:MFS transporter, DHA1 family, inner membrane transport protein
MSSSLLLALLTAVNFTHILDFVIVMPLGPMFMRTFSINATQFGFLVSAYGFSAAIFGFLAAAFVDKFDRKLSFLFCYLGFIVGTLFCAIANQYEVLFLARVIAGAFGGAITGVIFAVVSDTFPIEKRGKAMGILMSAFSMATVLGVPFGLWLANSYHWHTPFVVLSAISFVLFGFALIQMPRMSEHLQKKEHRSFAQAILADTRELFSHLANKSYLKAFSFVFVLMLGGFSVIPFISPYMVFNVGLPESKLPLVYLCGGLCTLFSSPLFGRLSDKFGARKMFTILAVISVPVILTMTHLPQVAIPVGLVVTSLFMIFVAGRMVPGMTLVTSVPNPLHRGAFLSLNGSVQQMGAGVASLVSGQMIAKSFDGKLLGYDAVGWMAIAFTGLAVVLSAYVKPEPKD